MLARIGAVASEHVFWLSPSLADPVAPTQPHAGWDTLLGRVLLTYAPYCVTVARSGLWPPAVVVRGIHTYWFELDLPHHGIGLTRDF